MGPASHGLELQYLPDYLSSPAAPQSNEPTIMATTNMCCVAFKFFFNVYLFFREGQSVNGEGAEREGGTESEAGSRL